MESRWKLEGGEINMNKLYRQGDVLLKQIDKLPLKAKKKEDKVVAYGEATGHKHEFKNSEVELYLLNSRLYAQVGVPSPLIHPEHDEIEIEPGVYKIDQEREYDYFENDLKKEVD